MNDKVFKVLFLCTGNSARSIMSEGLLNHLGKGRFQAFSAGSHPNGTLNKHAIGLLGDSGCDTMGMRSKSWGEFEGAAAPTLDIVITVCDNAAGETCPIWPGHPAQAHWGYEDPHGETEEQARNAFRKVFRQIRRRIELLVSLPDDRLKEMSVQHALQEIGRAELD